MSNLKDVVNNLVKETKSAQNTDKQMKNKKSIESSLEEKIKNRYSWLIFGVVCLVFLLSSFVIIYNLLSGRQFTIDVATILSTLLAFFSIFLSSIFYFKATEQSNQFYDRSYNHTKDIAMTLAKMEGKFGNSLENINALSMQLNDRMERISNAASNVKSEQIDSKILYKELIEKAQLSEEEKRKYEEALDEKETTINNLINEIDIIGKKVVNNRIRNFSMRIVDSFFNNFIDEYDFELSENPNLDVRLRFKNYLIEKGDNRVLNALKILGFLDKNMILTNEGLERLDVNILSKVE